MHIPNVPWAVFSRCDFLLPMSGARVPVPPEELCSVPSPESRVHYHCDWHMKVYTLLPNLSNTQVVTITVLYTCTTHCVTGSR